MNIFAIDTSSKRLSLGIKHHNGKVIEYNFDSRMNSSELLLPFIKKALVRTKLPLSKVDYFVVGLGPGSFTGLRIGLATIKGFAYALNKPIIGLATLDILAANAPITRGRVICPVIDAKRHLLFTAIYEISSGNKIRRRSPYLLTNVDQLLDRLGTFRSVTFLGDGLYLYQAKISQKIKNSIFLNEDSYYPKGNNIINLSIDLINRKKFIDAKRIKPIYLYPKECQIRHAKTHR